MRVFLLSIAFLSVSSFAQFPSYYTPVEVADRYSTQLHPGETPRDERYFHSVLQAGRNIACASAVAAYLNNELSKVFHNGLIEVSAARWTRKEIPAYLRKGLFSDEVAAFGPLLGMADLTTGRWWKHPWQLVPDVTGLTVALVINGKWVVLTATGSKGAFAKTLLGFSRLAKYSAMGAIIGGFMSPSRLRENLLALRDGETENSSRRYVSPQSSWHPRRVLAQAGAMLGESAFFLRHPISAFGTLLPAVLDRRRNPLLGRERLGTGQAYLLDETAPFADRVAFRLEFELSDNDHNREMAAQIDSWLKTLRVGAHSDHLSNTFRLWQLTHSIDFDVVLVEIPNSLVENPHRRATGKRTVVATLSLERGNGDHTRQNEELTRIARTMPFNPGFGMHLPLGDLGYGRAAGPLIGADFRASGQTAGAYWVGAAERRAQGLTETGIDEAAINRGLDALQRALEVNGIQQ